jgi:hypothetical protein
MHTTDASICQAVKGIGRIRLQTKSIMKKSFWTLMLYATAMIVLAICENPNFNLRFSQKLIAIEIKSASTFCIRFQIGSPRFINKTDTCASC